MAVAKKTGLDAHNARAVAGATRARKGEGWRGFSFQKPKPTRIPTSAPPPAPLPEVFETGSPRVGAVPSAEVAPPRPAPTALCPGARPVEPAPSRPEGNVLVVTVRH